MVILFPPGTYIHYGCETPGYNDDWIHFILSGKEIPFLSSLSLPYCTPLYPHNFHRLSSCVAMISDTYHEPAKHFRQITNTLMQTLLYALDEELEKASSISFTHKFYSEFARIRTQLYNSPSDSWRIADLADSLHISISYFQHLYKLFFSCSCQQDIITARLKQAKFYLSTSDMSIRNIADFCGYESEVHFMRQFKKFVGVTPSSYRNSLRLIGPSNKIPSKKHITLLM